MIPFREAWTCDTEFQASPGDRPHVLCLVARELRSGRQIRLWRDDLVKLIAAPFDVGEGALFVAFFASAELSCFAQLGRDFPVNVIDLFAEHRALTNGLPGSNSLLSVVAQRGLASMAAAEKTAKRALIMQQQSWTPGEIEEILHYCAADVGTTEALLKDMVQREEISWPHALWRGRYMAAVARMEHTGIPIDTALYYDMAEHWTELKEALVETVSGLFGL